LLLAGFGHAFRFDRFAAAPRTGWAHAVGRRNMRVIGLLEIAGAIGVVAPAATGILPWLTPVAAAGLALIMMSAAIFHARRGEMQAIISNVVLFAVAAFVFVGRSFVEPL
jgi:DoxX-like family